MLSKRNATNDLREKLLEYKHLVKLQTYLIVDSETLWVNHFRDGAEMILETKNPLQTPKFSAKVFL